MDPNQMNQLNSNLTSINQINQLSYYQKGYQIPQEQMTESYYTTGSVNPQYQGYYIGGMTNLMSSPNSYSPHAVLTSGQSHQPHQMNSLNNSI